MRRGPLLHMQSGRCLSAVQTGELWDAIWAVDSGGTEELRVTWPATGRVIQQKMGWFEVVRGHSTSWAMPPFDRAHTTSYSTLIETMCLSFTVLEIHPAICRKLSILTHLTCIWCPRKGWPWSNFAEIFGIGKLDSLGYRVVLFVWSCVKPF